MLKKFIDIIGFADDRHTESLVSLWMNAFKDDSESFVRDFIKGYTIPQYNVPIICDSGNPVSALYLVDLGLYSHSSAIGTCSYLCAAATHPDYRGRGYMSALVEYALEISAGRGTEAVFVLPESPGLFDFYAKNGFAPHFFASSKTFEPGEKLPMGYAFADFPPNGLPMFERMYEAYAGSTVKQSISPLKDRLFFYKCAVSYTGDPGFRIAEVCENGVPVCHIFYRIVNNICNIDDIIINESDNGRADEIIKGTCGCFTAKGMSCRVTLPQGMADSAETFPVAMLAPLGERAKSAAAEKGIPPYINMYMNI